MKGIQWNMKGNFKKMGKLFQEHTEIQIFLNFGQFNQVYIYERAFT